MNSAASERLVGSVRSASSDKRGRSATYREYAPCLAARRHPGYDRLTTDPTGPLTRRTVHHRV